MTRSLRAAFAVLAIALVWGWCGGAEAAARKKYQTIFVPDQDAVSITEYPTSDKGDASPLVTITGPDTLLVTPAAVGIEPDDDILVCGFGSPLIGRFAPNAIGDAMPISTIRVPTRASSVALGWVSTARAISSW